MSTHEVRHKGTLLGHFREAEANEIVRRHFQTPEDKKARDEDDFTIARRKPYELSSRGNLVDTFDTEHEAHEALDKHVEELREAHKASGRGDVDVEGFFEVHEVAHPAAPPPPPPPEPRHKTTTHRRGP